MDLLTLFNTSLARLGEYRVSTTDPTSLPDTTAERALLEKITLQYAQSRDNLLSRYRWSFAKDFREVPLAYVTMTSIANSSGVAQVTLAAHGLTDGMWLLLENTVGTDGRWKVTGSTTNTFKLEGSVWNANIVAGRYVVVPAFGYDYRYEIPSDVLRVNTVNGKMASTDRTTWLRVGKFIHSCSPVCKMSVIQQITNPALFPAEFTECLVVQLAADISMSISGANADRQGLLQELETIHIPKARMNNAIDRKQDTEQGPSGAVSSRLTWEYDRSVYDPYPDIQR